MNEIVIKLRCRRSKDDIEVNLTRKDYKTSQGMITCWSSANHSNFVLKVFVDSNSEEVKLENIYKGTEIYSTEKEIAKEFKLQFAGEYQVETY